jgi:SAM-dependent methyltransferase
MTLILKGKTIMRIDNPAIVDAIEALPIKDTLLNEAQFGYEYLHPYLNSLPTGARILEVGSGPCVLLSHLAESYPHLHFTGIEPIGDGFELFRDAIAALSSQFPIDIFRGGYEDFRCDITYDLIFLVNVFEHLPDWRDFLAFVKQRLSATGVCVILCPNYSFPYESHFRLPIIINKQITFYLFESFINKYERANHVEGLWKSLNYVKLRHVKQTCRDLGLALICHPTITLNLIQRTQTDKSFADRQRVMGAVARILHRLGIARTLLRLFPAYNPYMFLEIRKKP